MVELDNGQFLSNSVDHMLLGGDIIHGRTK